MLSLMAYLGVDCSSPYLALALYDSGVLASFCEDVGRDHAKRITGALDTLFEQAGLTPGDLRGVSVGVGPGSYTGLRVGVATAQGLARGLNVPLRGEGTLLAMAAGVLGDAEPHAVVALDARRGNVYAGVFRFEAGEVKLEGELFKGARADLTARNLPYFENVPPDAGFLARRGTLGANAVTPIYL